MIVRILQTRQQLLWKYNIQYIRHNILIPIIQRRRRLWFVSKTIIYNEKKFDGQWWTDVERIFGFILCVWFLSYPPKYKNFRGMDKTKQANCDLSGLHRTLIRVGCSKRTFHREDSQTVCTRTGLLSSIRTVRVWPRSINIVLFGFDLFVGRYGIRWK